MDPKLLEDDGLVLEECLLEVADGGLPFPCFKTLISRARSGSVIKKYLVLLAFVV